jgi:putative N6-adenine-specific DNA methylase
MISDTESQFEMVAKTFHGLEDILAGEIRVYGGKDIEILNRAVRFQGNKAALYKMNLYLHTALRILVPVIQTQIKNQVDLYARIREYEWEKHLQPGMTMAVDSFLSSAVFTNSQFVSLRTKDAIVDRLREKYNRRPSVHKTNPDLLINVHLAGNQLTVSLDTSGQSLHKRGYRVGNFEAPLNEVLAAGLIMLTGWEGEHDFYDPMCGSGTLGIEAALIARKIPPGIFRKKFGFENSPDFDAQLLEDIFENIQEKNWEGKVYSSDISKQALQMAIKNARQASVYKNIVFRGIDFRDYPKITGNATVIINPPYGQRMVNSEIIGLYKSMGDTMKKKFEGAEIWIISSNLEAFKHIGLKPSDKLKLFNGALECRFNKYYIYPGSKKNNISKK